MKKLFVLYTLFLLLFSIFSYLFIDPNFFYLKIIFTNFHQLHRLTVTMLFILCVICFYTFYLFFLHFIQQQRLQKKDLFFIIGITCITLILAYPAILSFDIFNYIATAKVTFLYHENPYIIMPMEFTKDSILLFMHAANKTALYAPFWLLLTAIPFLLGFGNFLLILFNFKLMVVIFYILTVLLLFKMTASIYKTAFFAFNPLVIIETLVSGHNDIVMMFLLLCSVYLFLEKKAGKSFTLYVLSIGIKYATLITLPLFPIAHIKKWKQKEILVWITIFMTIIFLLSTFREEIYPWYAIWLLVPGTFLIDNKLVKNLFFAFTFGLLLRYIPFMLLGTYFGPTPVIKVVVMVTPIIIVLLLEAINRLQRNFLKTL